MDYTRPLILIGIFFLYTVGASVVQRDDTDGREGESGGVAHYLSAMIQLLKDALGSSEKLKEDSPSTLTTPSTPREAKDVVIVTDIAIGLKNSNGRYGDVDDAYAIYRILLEHIQDRVNVIAIVVQFGNADNVTEMYQKLETLVGKMELPMTRPPQLIKGPSTPYNPGGSIDILVGDNPMNELFNVVKNNPKRVTVIGVGPATTIAYLMDDKEAAVNVGEIYLEMGQYGSEWGDSCGFEVCSKPVGDFNFKMDVPAVQHLLDLCPTKLYFTPFQIIEKLKMDDWDVMGFLRSEVRVEKWLAEETSDWFEQWTKIFECEDFIHIWDTVPLLVGSDILYNSCNFVEVSAKVHPCASSVQSTSLALTDYVSGSDTKPSMVCPHYRYKPTILAPYQY